MRAKEKYSAALHRAQDEAIAVAEHLDTTSWALARKQEALEETQAHIQALNDRYKHEKEVGGTWLSAARTSSSQHHVDLDRVDRTRSHADTPPHNHTTTQHIGKQQLANTEEMRMFEQQIRTLKQESAALLAACQLKLQKLTTEYEQLSRTFAEEKERRVSELVGALEEVVNFQQHVSESLKGLQALVEE